MVRDLLRPSTLILFAANFDPVIGVVFWGWNIFQLMMLYWMETIIILFWTVAWLATSPLLNDPKHRWNAGAAKASSIWLTPCSTIQNIDRALARAGSASCHASSAS